MLFIIKISFKKKNSSDDVSEEFQTVLLVNYLSTRHKISIQTNNTSSCVLFLNYSCMWDIISYVLNCLLAFHKGIFFFLNSARKK